MSDAPKLESAEPPKGALGIIFLIVLSGLLYLSYKQVWRGVKH